MLKQEAGSVEEWIFLFVNCFVVLVANWRFFSPSYLLHIHVSCIMVKLYRRQCYNKTYVHVLSLFFMSNKTMSLWCFFSCHIFYCITKNLHDAVNCIRHLRKHFRVFSDFYWNCSSDGSSTLYSGEVRALDEILWLSGEHYLVIVVFIHYYAFNMHLYTENKDVTKSVCTFLFIIMETRDLIITPTHTHGHIL